MNHALIRLREELLILRDIWRHVNGDAAFPDRGVMLAQLDREMREVREALILLGTPRVHRDYGREPIATAGWLAGEARA